MISLPVTESNSLYFQMKVSGIQCTLVYVFLNNSRRPISDMHMGHSPQILFPVLCTSPTQLEQNKVRQH